MYVRVYVCVWDEGDIAQFPYFAADFKQRVRIEHWDVAQGHGRRCVCMHVVAMDGCIHAVCMCLCLWICMGTCVCMLRVYVQCMYNVWMYVRY